MKTEDLNCAHVGGITSTHQLELLAQCNISPLKNAALSECQRRAAMSEVERRDASKSANWERMTGFSEYAPRAPHGPQPNPGSISAKLSGAEAYLDMRDEEASVGLHIPFAALDT